MTKQVTTNDPVTGAALRIAYDGIIEAVDDVRSKQVACRKNKGEYEYMSASWGGEWFDYKSASWLDRALEGGERKTLDRIAKMQERIEAESPAFTSEKVSRHRVRRRLMGDEMNVGLFVAREGRDPFVWEGMVRENTPRRVIRIGVEIGVLGSRTADDLLPRGAAACALVGWLEANGYAVEVIGVWCSEDIFARRGKARGIATVVVKASDVPMNEGTLATACCEIAFARGVLLTARVMNAPEEVAFTLGRTSALTKEEAQALALDVTIDSDVLTEARAVEWLTKTVERLSTTDAE